MEQVNFNHIPHSVQPQVTLKPDKEERREIRRRYNKSALVLIINILIFNGLGIGGGFIIALIFKEKFLENEFLVTFFSCAVPIISEITAIIVGAKLFGLRFKPMINRNGFTGGTMFKLITLCLGLQTAAALIAAFIAFILDNVGLTGHTPDLTPTVSLPANLFMYFYACLLGPILEELLYRGVLLQSMRKYNERFAIFLSAIIFGLMHQNYQQFILGFLVGIPLAVVTIKSGSVLPAIITHIIMNTSTTLTTCWLQYTSPEIFDTALNSTSDAEIMSMLSPSGMFAMMANVIFRYGFMLAALIVGIVVLVKGKNMSRPTPAGKARTWPIFITSVCWWLVFMAYAFLNLVYPFM